jgi:hypothetical protein
LYISPVLREINKIPENVEWSQNFREKAFLDEQKSNFIDCVDTSDPKFIKEFNRSQDMLPNPEIRRGFVFAGWSWKKDSITRQEAMKSTKCSDKFKEDVDLIKRNKQIEDEHYSISYFLKENKFREALLLLTIAPFLLSIILITKVRNKARLLLHLLLLPIKKVYGVILNWLNN